MGGEKKHVEVKEMRVFILVSSIVVSLLFIMAIGKNSLAQPNGNGFNCADFLNDNGECWGGDVRKCEYKCENKIDVTEAEQPEWELEFYFGHPGPTSDPDRLLAGFESGSTEIGVFGCQCLATGSFNNPKFDTANWFHCVGPMVGPSEPDPPRIYSLSGHVVADGDRIQQGEAVNDIGRSWVFECDFDKCECESPND